jgi:hypothetical protein
MKLKIVAALVMIIATSGWVVEAQGTEEKTNAFTQLPLVGDETSVSTLIASPREYLERPVIIVGGLKVGNYYNYAYDHASGSYFSLNFIELTKDMKRNEGLTIYAERSLAAPLVDRILKAQQKGNRLGVRVKIKITARSFMYGNFNENAELLDWQFLKPDHSGWKAWVKESEEIEIEKLNKARQVELDKQRQAAIEAAEKRKQAGADRALKYNQDLADKGDAYGQLRMGERYLNGDGVEKNETKAKDYLSKAAAQGSIEASNILANISSHAEH